MYIIGSNRYAIELVAYILVFAAYLIIINSVNAFGRNSIDSYHFFRSLLFFLFNKKIFYVGDDLGTYVLRESVLKEEQITSPSLGWLLPSKLFWKENEVLVQTEQKNYTLLNLKQFFA